MNERTEPTLEQAIALLQRAQALAERAAAAGHHPFGALLVGPDHETVLMEQGNVDSVNHAEAVLAREAARRFTPAELWGCTLVTTVEPCAMCAGTQYWAHKEEAIRKASHNSVRRYHFPQDLRLDAPNHIDTALAHVNRILRLACRC